MSKRKGRYASSEKDIKKLVEFFEKVEKKARKRKIKRKK